MIEFKPYLHHGVELEEAVLGVCLLEKMAFGRTYGIVNAECFYSSAHKEVYGAMKEMFDTNRPLDILTVSEYLIAQKGIEQLGSCSVPYFITKLTNSVVSSAHLEYHCRLIREMWQRREVLKLRSAGSQDEGFSPHENITQINQKINEILGTGVQQDWHSMDQLMYDLMIHQHEMSTGKKNLVTTGLKNLDKMNGGFAEGNMIIIASRPSVGKSAILGKMSINIAKAGKKVGIISLEMNNNEIAARLASLETDIDFATIYRTIANDKMQHERFYDIISKFTINLPIYVSSKTKVNISEIRAKAMKLKQKHGCDILFIDYLQLVDTHTENKNSNREQEVAKLSRGIKMLAMDMEIPVVALCQLNRAVTHRDYKNRFPRLSDLRESGSLEQDADVVMFLHRDWMAGWQSQPETGNSTINEADLVGAKWRNGATFHLPLEFDPAKMKFSEKIGFSTYAPPQELLDFTEGKKDETPF